MDTNKLSLVENEYDDGVVCFGPVTESQLNRYKRLPRRTVLPSDFELSQSFFEQDEDKKNGQCTVLDESSCVNTTCVDNSINITRSTDNFGEEKEEIGAIELKQSFFEDSNSKFSSPCFSKCLPNAKLMDTEVINRYIRMGSTSSNDSSLSEDQNKSTFEDETVSFTNAQETESIQDNYAFDETSTCEHLSVSSVIEQSASINQLNVLDGSNNVCTLIHCSQKDDTDLSICSDTELGDVTEDSIVADEYSVTPGKQRLFDSRVTKQSLRAKALIASAPFMDRIEETTTPVVPKVFNSPLNDISYRHSEIKESLNVLSTTEIRHGTSTKNFNQTSNENMFETSGELLISNDLKINVGSVNKNVDSMFNETMKNNTLSTNNRSMDLIESLNETNIENTLNDTEHIFNHEKSMNIMSNMTIPTSDVVNHNDEEFSVATDVDIKSTDTSCVVKELDETVCFNRLLINNQSMDFNKSINETNIENTLNDTEHKFDSEKLIDKTMGELLISNNLKNNLDSVNKSVDTMFDETVKNNTLLTNNRSMDLNQFLNETEHKFHDEKSKCNISNKTIPSSDISYRNDEEFSVAKEIDIKSTNTSCVDKELNETACTKKLSINNRSMDLNKSLDVTNIKNTLNATEHKYNHDKSMNIMSDMAILTSDVNDHNNEEFSVAIEVDIKSTNTSCVDKELGETVCTRKLSINNRSMDFNKSLDETNIENTLNDTEHKYNHDKSMNIMSNIDIRTSDVNDYYDEECSVAMEVDIKSTNTSCADKELGETVCTNWLSINNQSTDLNKSVNETEHNCDSDKSMNIISNITIPTSDVNHHNNEEFSVAIVDHNYEELSVAKEVDIKSTNASCVDKELNETVYSNKLSINNQSMDMSKSLNETNVENTLDDTEHILNGEKSMNIISNIVTPLSDVNDHYDNENPIATKIDIKSINTSIVGKIFDESMLINANKLLTDSSSMNCNKSLNELESTPNNTEHRFMNNIQNTSVSAIHFDDKLLLSKLDKSLLKNTISSDNSFVGINEVNITCNTSLEDPSCMMRQYLDFEQTVNEMCNDISSASCPGGKLNKPKESYDDETIENLIEQTLFSDSFNLTNVNENFSNYDGSNLSVIIEHKSLETSCNSIEQNEEFVTPNNVLPITLESESIVKEVNDIESLNKSTVVNTLATPSKSEVDLAYGTDTNIQIKANESLLINSTITDSGLVENMNETKSNRSSMFSDELSKMELVTFTKINNMNNIDPKQIFISENVNEIHSTQNNLNENNLYPIPDQINITDIPNSTAFKLIPETEITQKNLIDQDELLNNDNQQQDLMDTTKCIDNNIEEFTSLEQMFNFGDNKKENQEEYKTPKTQKLLDFSIIQQTPTFDNPAKKQKLLNFSIVDQTPILQSNQQIYPNNNVINNDSLINFSSVDQMWNSEVMTKGEINFKDLQNSSNNSSSNNLSTISAPDVELLVDESIKTNASNFSNSSFDQTITNLNLSTYSCVSNTTQNSATELNNLEPLMLINRQADKPSDSLNQTIEQNESRLKAFNDKHYIAEASTKAVNSDLKLSSNTTLNKNIDYAEFKEDSNQEPRYNSNERAIVDFSIIDQGILENVELKNNTDITSFEPDKNVSNLIEMSLVTKSDEQSIILSENPIIPITSQDRSEKSIHSISDEINSTALQLEESTFLHNNTELLTDIQMNDESLLTESLEKSSIIDSFHSIELNHVQEDNKRKMETTQEYDNNEKKMKVETEMLKTPMSMLYKIKNMFRSSERQPSCVNNSKENNFKSDKCYQKLKFNNLEENNENFTKPITFKKAEVIVKSKIPCKVTDRSLIKNDDFNYSSLSSLNDSIKQKKTIPKYSGAPVLSDVSNSSNRKCGESRIPSKFQK